MHYAYDYVFLCNGFSTFNKDTLVLNGIQRVPFKNTFTTPMLFSYASMGSENGSVEDDVNGTLQVFSKEYLLRQYRINPNVLNAFIAIIYRTNLYKDSFEEFLQENSDPSLQMIDTNYLKKANFWIEGFNSLTEFITMFSETYKFLLDFFQTYSIEQFKQIYDRKTGRSPEYNQSHNTILEELHLKAQEKNSRCL